MNILHINSNFEQSKIHYNLIEAMNQKIDGRVFYPIEKNNKNIREISFVDEVPCLSFFERYLFYYRNNHLHKVSNELYNYSKFDGILAHSLYSNGTLARTIATENNIPYSVIVTNTDLNLYMKRIKHLKLTGLRNLLGAKSIIFSSEAYRSKIITDFVPKKYQELVKTKSYNIPFGIDDFWLENKNRKKSMLEKNKIRLLYAGKINYNKNLQTTLDACKSLRIKGYEISLTVVGNPTDKYGEKLVKKLSDLQYVKYMPSVKFSELIKIYRENDIFVMPSYAESFGLVYPEAMSQGLPVIYSKGQGFDKQFDDYVVGVPVQSNSSYEIVKAIEYIWDNYEKLALNAYNYSNNFKWKVVSKKYINAIH